MSQLDTAIIYIQKRPFPVSIGCEETSLADVAGAAGGYFFASRCNLDFAMFFNDLGIEFVGQQSGQILSLDGGQGLFLPIHLQSSRRGCLDVQNG